jgi:hypothetical protein
MHSTVNKVTIEYKKKINQILIMEAIIDKKKIIAYYFRKKLLLLNLYRLKINGFIYFKVRGSNRHCQVLRMK